jgi:large subunit ribosomal protein L30
MAKAKSAEKNRLKLTLVRSSTGRLPSHKATLNGLGLKTIRQSVELEDTPSVRGMINKVSYLLTVEQV